MSHFISVVWIVMCPLSFQILFESLFLLIISSQIFINFIISWKTNLSFVDILCCFLSTYLFLLQTYSFTLSATLHLVFASSRCALKFKIWSFIEIFLLFNVGCIAINVPLIIAVVTSYNFVLLHFQFCCLKIFSIFPFDFSLNPFVIQDCVD